MLIANLAGGIGNQMFQYAMGFSMGQKTGQTVKYSSTFSQYSYNTAAIDSIFNLKIEWCSPDDLRSCLGLVRSSAFARRLLGKASELSKFQICNNAKFDLLQGFEVIDMRNINANYYLHGYWQSELYFNTYFSKLRDDFTFQDERSISEISSTLDGNEIKIGVHIRRGDYIQNDGMLRGMVGQKRCLPLSVQYFVDGLIRLRKKFKNAKIVVFSDDINWAHSVLSNLFENIYFSNLPNSNAASDLQMLSQCDHFVISNSTFSWWGAYLSCSPEKIVITPNKWFAGSHTDYDIIPPAWIDSQKLI